MVDNNKVNELNVIAQQFEEEFDSEFYEIVETSYDYKPEDYDGEFPEYELHVVIQEKNHKNYSNAYTYPAAQFGRDRGLFLFDTVTNWTDNTITLRFGLEN